jgi:hypothetical protein
MPLTARQKELAAQAEKENGLPAGLLSRLIEKESGGNSNALSPMGARGSVQFMPQTAKQYGVDPNNDDSSIAGAGRFISDLKKKYNGNMRAALAHYNGGAYNAQRELDGSDAARPDKVSAANNAANKKYIGFFDDILGGGGNVNSSMPTVGEQTPPQTTTPSQGQQPNMNAQQIVELMKQMQQASTGDNSTPINQTDVLPSALSDAYAGTTQSAANPSNPRASGISSGDPSNVNSAIDEYMKRYHDRLPIASLAQAFSGFGGGGPGMVAAAAQPWADRDKKDYLDTVGRVTATQDAAQKAQNLADSGQKSELERANFAQSAPGANLNAATQKNLGNPNSVLSAGIKNAVIAKLRAAGVPIDPALASMTGMEAITVYGKYVPEMLEALKLPSNVSQSQSAAAKSAAEVPGVVADSQLRQATAKVAGNAAGKVTGEIPLKPGEQMPTVNAAGASITPAPYVQEGNTSAAKTQAERDAKTQLAQSQILPQIKNVAGYVQDSNVVLGKPGAWFSSLPGQSQDNVRNLLEQIKQSDPTAVIPDPTKVNGAAVLNALANHAGKIQRDAAVSQAYKDNVTSGKMTPEQFTGSDAFKNAAGGQVYFNAQTGQSVVLELPDKNNPGEKAKYLQAKSKLEKPGSGWTSAADPYTGFFESQARSPKAVNAGGAQGTY